MSSASSMNSLTVATAAIFGSLGLLWLYKKLRSQRRRAGLKDKVVLITGASSGVGEACAIAFYRLGCKVILCARRAPELERVKKELMALKLAPGIPAHTPHVIPLDLERLDELPDKAKEALELHGYVDILINNGGMSGRGSVVDTVLSVHQKIMNVNHFGSLVLTSAILPNMISRRSGHILAVSSIQGRIAIPFRSAYSASKHAMQAFFDSLRAEVAEHNIQVTVLSPSYIKTNISLSALDGDGSVHAKMDSTTAGGMSTVYVADKVVDAVAKQQRDVVLGPFTHGAAIYIRALVPNLYFWIMAGRARKGTKMED
ncbi:dehydrogenase/reductase SDR family protein 7-like [Strongylocentrotus purpuratus]|uniref:Dehydrogenase/reductase SDR family protein 7-like n=1 Tax=Strongylocentrotus purpuratus TaxID=7668 RepID=A0A7M7PUD1_STRPU|nr:dehydrogenase/reductase SDR family protein 7-like [Strongylocentrotus purpuratus]